MPTVPLRERPAWKALEHHYAEIAGGHLRELFADDPGRGERLTRRGRRAFTSTTRRTASPTRPCGCWSSWPRSPECAQRRDAMFAGEQINVSENRSVLHVALRMPEGTSLIVDGVDVVARGARGAATG